MTESSTDARARAAASPPTPRGLPRHPTAATDPERLRREDHPHPRQAGQDAAPPACVRPLLAAALPDGERRASETVSVVTTRRRAAACAAVALLLMVAAAAPSATRRPPSLLGVVGHGKNARLEALDPRTLVPLSSPRPLRICSDSAGPEGVTGHPARDLARPLTESQCQSQSRQVISAYAKSFREYGSILVGRRCRAILHF